MSDVSTDHSSVQQPKTRAVVPWNAWLGVFFVLAVFFGSQLLIGVLISFYPLANNWNQDQTDAWLSDSIPAQFMFILAAEALMVWALYWFLRHYKTPWSAIGLRRPKVSDVFYGIAGFVPYFVLYVIAVSIVSALVPGLDVDQEQQIGFNNATGAIALIMTFISLVVLPPIVEELMVRGFLYSTFKKVFPIILAAIATSLVFAAAHLPAGGPAGPLYIAAIDTFVLSLVLIYLREKTGGLWASITLHAIKNGIAFVSLFILKVV